MRRISFLIILVILVSSSVISAANSCPPIPSSIVYGSGGAQIERLNAWCKSVGGTPNNNGSAWSCINCPTSTATSSGYTIYDAAVDDFLRWLFSPNSTQAAQRRAALKQQLEAERQAAIARKQAEEVARLDAILGRLSSSLKGFNTSNDLQLKLSPTGPIKFGEYMATPATQTTSARLELKTGSEATRSLETPKPNASSAGVINPTPPTPLQAPTFDASQLSPEAKELAEMLSKLTPEQQQKLLATMKSIASAEQAATATTNATPANPEQKDPPLTLKLSEAQKSADDLKTAAADPNSSPEELKKQAADQFKQLQQTTASGTPPAPSSATNSYPPNSTPPKATPAVRSNDTGKRGAVSTDGIGETEYFYALQSGTLSPMKGSGRPIVSSPLSPGGKHGLVGGTTWTYGFQWPAADCDKTCEDKIKAEVCLSAPDPKKCEEEGLPFTAENYDLVTSMASSHSILDDLATRVIFDNATLGEFTKRKPELFSELKGREFDVLDCHSNGAMLCLAALRGKLTAAKTVRLFGPQITPEAAKIWRDLSRDEDHPFKLEIYINTGDPVPALAWKLPKFEPEPDATVWQIWKSNKWTLTKGLAGAVINAVQDVRKNVMDDELKAFGFTVKRTPCSSFTDPRCHSMLVYEQNIR